MTVDRAALVEKVAQMFCSQVDLECSECRTEGGCWYTDTATAAIDLIRAEVLEEAADAVNELGDGAQANDYAAAIRALKEKA